MGKAIGIDLGTTNSCVAFISGGEPEIIINEQGHRTTSSVISKSKTGTWLVGQIARRQAITAPDKTIVSIKRFMGLRYDEALTEVQRAGYQVVKAPGTGLAVVEVDGETFTPQEVSARILQALKLRAEEVLGEEVTDAVITVPAYFNDAQRQATKDAGRIAGLNVLRIINEPTAAALAYGANQRKQLRVAVYDLGGGTFDISILTLGDGVYEVKSTAGDTHLGGDDLDQVVIDWLVAGFREEHGIDLARDRVAVARLKDAAEKAKCELSSALETHINLPFIASNDSGPVHLDVMLGRARFESLVGPLIERTVDPCRQALADAHFESGQVEEVLLVGGSTRIPLVQQTVRRIFNQEPNRSVNQDEVVAMGAALHAGILQGAVDEILLLDVTPLSLGIETFGGVMTKLIERNTTIPTRRSQTFSTAIDNQNAVSVHVLQGEREMASDNRSLARFDLVGIPPAPRGVPQVEVVFDIDANGIVSVSATDLGTGRKQQIQVHASGNLSEVEISRLITEAEVRREEDLAKRRAAEIRNRAELMLMNVTTALAEYGGSVSEEERSAIEGALADVRQALEDAATERLTALTDTLAQRSHVIADQLYSR